MGRTSVNKERIIKTAKKLFIQNGYEKTSLQDILDDLGDITKGSIYHHFQSKDDIFDAVILEMEGNNMTLFNNIMNNKNLLGAEKLKTILLCSINGNDTSQIIDITPNYLENPKFLIAMINQIKEISIPNYILPIIKMGVADGSINTIYPNELAELIIVLLNLWINPLLFNGDGCTLEAKCYMINDIVKPYGFILFDEELISSI